MPETSQMYKCLDLEDKKLMLRIIDDAISKENLELRKIETRKMHQMLVPPFVESFTGIRSSLIRVHKDFIKNIEDLKKRVEGYNRCMATIKQPVTETGYGKESLYATHMPYHQRKVF